MKEILIYALLVNQLLIAQNSSNSINADPLSETPLHPIPPEMTFDEYQDMNRRLSQAFLWSSVPIPGITHYYAGEKKMAKRLFYIGLGGVACVIGGSLSMGDPTWPDYNENIHIIHDQGTENERRYERVPVSMEGDIVHYELREIHKQHTGDGGKLIALGIVVIISDFIYDRLKGLQLVEEKRNRVRYKFGQQLQFTYKPTLYFSSEQNEFGMKLNFDFF